MSCRPTLTALSQCDAQRVVAEKLGTVLRYLDSIAGGVDSRWSQRFWLQLLNCFPNLKVKRKIESFDFNFLPTPTWARRSPFQAVL